MPPKIKTAQNPRAVRLSGCTSRSPWERIKLSSFRTGWTSLGNRLFVCLFYISVQSPSSTSRHQDSLQKVATTLNESYLPEDLKGKRNSIAESNLRRPRQYPQSSTKFVPYYNCTKQDMKDEGLWRSRESIQTLRGYTKVQCLGRQKGGYSHHWKDSVDTRHTFRKPFLYSDSSDDGSRAGLFAKATAWFRLKFLVSSHLSILSSRTNMVNLVAYFLVASMCSAIDRTCIVLKVARQ